MDIQDLLNDLGIDYRIAGEHHHATRGHLSIDCPWCSPSSGRFRLGISIRRGFANCWTCGPHSLYEILFELTGSHSHLKELSFDESANASGRGVKKSGSKLNLPEGIGPLLPIHKAYLQSRNFDPEELTRLWGIGGFGLHPKYCWRLFLPVHFQGEVVSFLTRSLGSAEPRYLNAKPEDEKLPLKSLLFGEDFVRNAILVCEGPFDAMRIGPGAVATMGLGYTSEQMLKVASYPIRVICFDSEEQAQKRARELARELAVFPGETSNIVLESGKDPAEASLEEIQEVRKEFLE